MVEEKERKKERSDIELIATPIVKFSVCCCLPWILISKLDRQLDENSNEGFEWWDFYWSFPATHLSWLVLTILFGLPLWGLLAAPLVLPICVVAGITTAPILTIVLAGIIITVIWIGLYHTIQKYRSQREVREIRKEIYREESEVRET